jgi:uncharacterized protein (DUF433 family)
MIERRGAYTAKRAAAISGVPWSTVHDWARKGVLVPSLSPSKVKLWSYTDLMGLRIIYWLRHPKQTADGELIPAASMKGVRKALDALAELEPGLWKHDHAEMLRVDRSGNIYVGRPNESMTPIGQHHAEVLELIPPFESEHGIRGPDLVRPRPHLRIIPGKLAGEPHIARTRLETRALAALARRGVTAGKIYQLYPGFEREAIDEALDLERQLARNLEPVSAAA